MGADAEIGNKHIVRAGNKWFKYDLVDGDTRFDCISKHEVLRCCVSVLDPWQSSKRYGAKTRWTELPDSVQARTHAAFFEVAGYKYTSLAEKPCNDQSCGNSIPRDRLL